MASSQDQYIQALTKAFSAFTPTVDPFQPIDPSIFADQAARESSPFFDKDLALVMKDLNLQREQRKATLAQQEQQQSENLSRFKDVSDKNFAQALDRTQSGFAGKGTFTSGFRHGNIAQLQQGQDQTIQGADIQAQQNTANRALDFSQFMNTSKLDEENAVFKNEQNKRQEDINRQLQLAGLASDQQSAAKTQFADQFKNFIGTKVGA